MSNVFWNTVWGKGAFFEKKEEEKKKHPLEIKWEKESKLLKKEKEEHRSFFRRRISQYMFKKHEAFSIGPWDIAECKGFYECFSADGNGHYFEIGYMAGRGYSKHSGRWRANASLIEVSPVLYAELKNLIIKVENNSVSELDLVAAKRAHKYSNLEQYVNYPDSAEMEKYDREHNKQ